MRKGKEIVTREQSSPKAVCCASAPSSSDEYGNNKCKEEPDIDDDVVMDHGEMKRGIEEAAGFSDTTDILAVCCAWAF